MLVLFDLDDTLLDHSSAFNAATAAVYRFRDGAIPPGEFAQRWAVSHRLNFDRYLAGQLTFEEHRRARVRETIDSSVSDAEADRIFDHYLGAYEEAWRLFDDVLPCLNALTGVALGVVTNGQPRQQRKKLERFGIAGRFAHVVVPEECGFAKPHARIFLAACAAFGCDPQDTFYVGDSYDLDACASRTAGLNGIWLDRRASASAAHAAPIIATLAELESVIWISRGISPPPRSGL